MNKIYFYFMIIYFFIFIIFSQPQNAKFIKNKINYVILKKIYHLEGGKELIKLLNKK